MEVRQAAGLVYSLTACLSSSGFAVGRLLYEREHGKERPRFVAHCVASVPFRVAHGFVRGD